MQRRWPAVVFATCFVCLVIGLAWGVLLCELRHREPDAIRYTDPTGVTYECVAQ